MLELRVAGLLVFASYLFSLDTGVLSQFGMNIAHAFGYRDFGPAPPLSVANVLLAVWACGSALFVLETTLIPTTQTRIVPLATLIAVIAVIIGQGRLRRVLKRIALGGLSAEHRLGDILVSDALVSLANVLVDVVFAFTLSVAHVPASQSMDRAAHIGPKTLLVASIPSGIRIKQCLLDFRRTNNRAHLLNLAKYLVGNMPHALRVQIASLTSAGVSVDPAWTATLTKSLTWSLYANAIYSLAWDLIMDWRLGRLFDSQTRLIYPRWSYYAAGVLDTVLRFTFLATAPAEPRVFTLQALEIARRGMWIAFRVESEPRDLSQEIEMQSL